jgi:hypothetical protein
MPAIVTKEELSRDTPKLLPVRVITSPILPILGSIDVITGALGLHERKSVSKINANTESEKNLFVIASKD